MGLFRTSITLIGAWSIGAYLYDVLWLSKKYGNAAREYADSVGKPFLNVGAGTPNSSLRVKLFGPTLFGDVNCDLAASQTTPCGPDTVCHCDASSLPYPDGYFGSALASHLIEHVDDPQAVAEELERVSDRVFVVVPKWWAPHTWLYTDHQWFVGQDGNITPLPWRRR